MREKASVKRHASHVCSSNIAILRASGIIGQCKKKPCKQHAAKLHYEALFKDPPPKEDGPICFLVPMPGKLMYCVSLPPTTLSFALIYDFAKANEGFAQMDKEE